MKASSRKLRVVLALTLATVALLAEARDHVLTITIGEYRPRASVDSLDGPAIDKVSALKMAQRMGFDISSAIQLHDSQATLAGIRNAVEQLHAQVAANDRIFFYYSGHGGTQRVGNSCQATLVTHDDEDLLSSELSAQMARIKAKGTKQMFVMFDACHSGEITERVAGAKGSTGASRLRVKARTSPKDGQPPCNAPVNTMETRVSATRSRNKATSNEELSGHLVVLSAARANEYAWDSAEGGEATVAALQCLSARHQVSSDGSGFISAQALAQCAQATLNARQPEGKVQHVVAHGEVTSPLAPSWGLPAQTVTSANRSLEDFVSSSDPTWRLQLEPYVGTELRASVSTPPSWNYSTQRIKIGGSERFQITIQSPRRGFLYLINASRERNDIALMWPRRDDLRAGKFPELQANLPYTIPWRWGAAGNSGQPEQNNIFAIVAERRIPDLEALLLGGPQAATGAFSEQLARAALPCRSATSGGSDCPRSPRKMLDDGEATDSGPARYGAARVLLDEY